MLKFEVADLEGNEKPYEEGCNDLLKLDDLVFL